MSNKTQKTALITGINGQDGSYLAELLLSKGYRVTGIVRRSSTETQQRIEHIRSKIEIYQADLLDQSSLAKVLADVQPDEVYNLAAMSFVPKPAQGGASSRPSRVVVSGVSCPGASDDVSPPLRWAGSGCGGRFGGRRRGLLFVFSDAAGREGLR